MRNQGLLLFPLLAGSALAQFPLLPTPTLVARAAPRAIWSAIVSSGPVQVGIEHRADTPGAATFDKLYVFGGCQDNNTSTTRNDLWAFDAIAGTFTLVNDGTVAPAPHARGRCSVAWNPLTNKLVVFGGDNRATGPLPADTLLNDTWEWDPITNAWADVTPAFGNPTPRRWAAMTFDPVLQGMLLFGGDTGASTVSNETWLFVGGAWAQLTPTTVPPARRMASLVTRDDFGDVLMCGGEDNSLTGPYGADLYRHLDVWTWNGSDWTLLSDWDWTNQTGTFPAGTIANQAVYDPLRKRVVMQGGQGIAANTAANTNYLFGTSIYNGSPTNYTSEFDCLTNSWVLYASGSLTVAMPYNNLDPAIGRISRYAAGFVPATGKVYKAVGQNGGNGLGSGTTGARPTHNVFEYQANPIASATDYGTGCAGPGGALTLAADGLPWTNRVWTGTCSNLGPTSLALSVWGASTAALPLNAVLPIAPPGCLLLNTAELLDGPGIPSGGQVGIALPIPDMPSLAGSVLHVQVAELEFTIGGWTGLYTSNGVTITVGAL